MEHYSVSSCTEVENFQIQSGCSFGYTVYCIYGNCLGPIQGEDKVDASSDFFTWSYAKLQAKKSLSYEKVFSFRMALRWTLSLGLCPPAPGPYWGLHPHSCHSPTDYFCITPGNSLPLLSYLMFSSPLLMLVSITNKQILYCIILYCICAKILKHNCTYYYTIYIIMHICIHNFIRVPLFSLVILQDCHNITGVFICQIFGLLGFVLVVSSVVYCGSGAFSGYAVNQFFDFIIMLCVITTAILYVTRLFKLHLRIFRCTCCFWPTVVSL